MANIEQGSGTGAKEVGISVGMIIPFAGNGAFPQGFLLCNGAELDKTIYTALFDVIGYTYGGSGQYFKLPDLRDKFIEGNSIGGTYLDPGLPNIEGSFSPFAEQARLATGSFYVISDDQQGSNVGGDNDNSLFGFDASRSNPIYGNSNTVQPPALTMRYIIRAFAGYANVGNEIEVPVFDPSILNDYLPLTGGTLRGNLNIGGTTVRASDGHIILASGLELY